MDCAAHEGITASERCSRCDEPRCSRCLVWDIDGHTACAGCGATEEERSRSIGGALVGLVGVGYLATLAIGYLVLRARPIVGGIAAVVAIALGRTLQVYLRPPVVTRRPS